MNNPNPFVPQGSLLEQKNRKRARVKIAVYSIFAFNIVLIAPFLLIQGCGSKKDVTPDTAQVTNTTDMASNTDTNVSSNGVPSLPTPGSNTLSAVSSNTIPTPPPAPEPPPAPAAQEYVVQKGDSYYTIGKKYNVGMKAIEAANPGVLPSKLKVGQKLQIPAGSGTGSSLTPAANGTSTLSDGNEATYTVKANDSLTKIAKANGVTVKAIKTANHLKTDKINVGQKLKIPAKAAAADTTPTAPVSNPTPISAPAPATAPVVTPGNR